MSKKLLASMFNLFVLSAQQYDDIFSPDKKYRMKSYAEHPKKSVRKLTAKEKALYSETKNLREFKIKGKTVLAYSKKDAIKRLKHST